MVARPGKRINRQREDWELLRIKYEGKSMDLLSMK